MKILCLRISGFGKFHDEKISFEDGLNLIQGDNESGKSTIHAFIRAMLFGAEKKQGRAAKDDFYTRYEPWSSPSEFRGSMDFEHKGQVFRITRSLYKVDKSVRLTCLDTGEEVPLPTGTITPLIPELTENAFRNTVSSEQQNLKPGAALSDQVQDYIANLSLARSREANVSGAINELEIRKKNLKRRLTGLSQQSQELNSEISELEELVERNDAAEKRLEELADKGKLLERELSGKREVLEQLKGRRPSEILEEHGITKPEGPGDGEAEKERLRESEEAEKEIQSASEKLRETFERVILEHSGRIEELNGRLAKAKLAAAFTGGIGALLCIIGNNRYAVALLAGLLLLLACVVILFFSFLGSRERKELWGAIRENELDREQQLADIRAGILADYADRAGKRAETLRAELTAYYDELNRLTEEFRNETEEAREEVNGISDRLHQNELERAELTGILNDDGNADNTLREKKNELEEINLQLEKSESDLRALELSMSCVEGLSEEIRRSFGKGLNRRLSELTALVTAGAYTEVRIDRDMNIEVMDKLDYVPLEKLSVGTMEQIRLALRFAVAELFYAEESVPVLLDESFAYCDDKRLSEIMKLISNMPGQILLFSCSSRERMLCEGAGLKVNIIEL